MKLSFYFLVILACFLQQCYAHKEFEVVKLFEKIAEEDEEKRTYGYHSDWSNTGISCISEFCTTVEGLIGQPSEPIYCSPEKIITMKTPPTENEYFDNGFNFKKSDNKVCLCNTSCFANLVEVKETNYANAVEKTEISSLVPINIISKSIIYQPNEYYEVKIIFQPEIVQYLVIIRINMPCKYAFIRIKDFDDHDGEILLGDICGTKFLWLYLDVDPTKNLKVQIRVKQLQFLHFYITVIPLKSSSNCKAPQQCTQLLNGYEGIFMSPNFGSDNKDLGDPHTSVNKEWRYRSCFKNACILRFLQLYPWNFQMKPANQDGALINGCSGSHLKFEDKKWLEAKYSGSWLFTTGEYCYNGNTLGKNGTDNVNILTRKYSTTVDLVMVKTTIRELESGYKLLFNKHNCEIDATTQVIPYETSKPAESLVIESHNQTTTTTTETLQSENINPDINEGATNELIPENQHETIIDSPVDQMAESSPELVTDSLIEMSPENSPAPIAENHLETITDSPVDQMAENSPGLVTDSLAEMSPESSSAPIADSHLETITESSTDQVQESSPEQVTDSSVEPNPESQPEIVIEENSETKPETITNSPVDQMAENSPELVTNSLIEVSPENSPLPIAESQPETITDSPANQMAESFPELVTDSLVEPIPESSPAPIVESNHETIIDPLVDQMAESSPELVTDSLAEMSPESSSAPIADSHLETITESPTDQVQESSPEQVTDSSVEPNPESQPEIVIEENSETKPETITNSPELVTDSLIEVSPENSPAPIAESHLETITDSPVDQMAESSFELVTDSLVEPNPESKPEFVINENSETQPEIVTNAPNNPNSENQLHEQPAILSPSTQNELAEIEQQSAALNTSQCQTCDMESCKSECLKSGNLFGECSHGECICAEYCPQYADYCQEVFYQKCPFFLPYCIKGIKSTLKCYKCENCCEICQNQGKTPTCSITNTSSKYTCNCI